MEFEERKKRMAAALEEEFQNCHSLLTGALAGITRRGGFDEWEMRNLVAMMRTTAQLATTVAKLGGKAESKNSENRGSIPQ